MGKSKNKLDRTFEIWLNETGFAQVSILLNASYSTVSFWARGKGLPKAKHMKRIKELTKGKINYEHIIDGSCSPLSK